jgi:uncharacterized protein (TIGR03435 family)
LTSSISCRNPSSYFFLFLAIFNVFALTLPACAQTCVQTSSTQIVPAVQPPTAAKPAFEVAAIRLNKTDTTGHSHIISSSSNGRFNAINVSLKSLVQWAFVMPDARILGGPNWFGSIKFDIEAKADDTLDEQLRSLPSATAKAQKQAMLQALLGDRFQMKTHEESRELPIYALVLAKDGPKFQPSQVNGTTINAGRGEIRVLGSDDTVALLADELGKRLGRVVVNQTGMHGRYELILKWAPDEAGSSRPGTSDAAGSVTDVSGPSIFTAIQEQLGLKLVPQKGPVSVLVIDQAEMPSEN